MTAASLHIPTRLRQVLVACAALAAALPGTALPADASGARPAQWGDPLPPMVAATSPAADPAPRPAPSPAERLGRGLDGTLQALPSAAELGRRLHLKLDRAWQDTHEAVVLSNPFVATPQPPQMPQRPPADAGRDARDRATRLRELPSTIGIPLALPLVDEAGAAAATAGLSLQEALELGLTHSFEVKAAQARLESFEHTARAAFGARLPQVEARAAVGDGTLSSVTPHEQRVRKDGTITLRQALFDQPAVREHQRQETLARVAALQLQSAVAEASVDIATAYLQTLQARILLLLGREHEAALDRLLTLINERARGGGTSLAERDRVQARVANARAQMAESRAAMRSALRRLATRIGRTPSTLLLELPAALDVPSDMPQAQDELRRMNRELLASRTEVTAAALEALVHRARLLPKLEAELSHSRTVNSGGTAGYTRDTRGMLVVSWPLYSGGTDLAQQRAALAREREKQALADDLRRRIEQDLETAYSALDTVGSRFTALREELVANTSVVAAFQAQLVGGNRPLLDVLDAYQRLHTSRVELATLVIGEAQNHVRVAHLTGRLGGYAEPADR